MNLLPRFLMHPRISLGWMLPLAFALGLSLAPDARGADRKGAAKLRPDTIPPEVFRLIEAKEDQLKDLALRLKLEVSDDVWDFFDTLREGSWKEIEAAFRELRRRAGQYDNYTRDPGVAGVIWSPTLECEMAYEHFALGERKYFEAFGRDILDSIPRGSLYFGGTDPGRSLPTAFSRDHAKGDPFFTLTQNALADGTYLQYLRAMYGGKIHVPTDAESSAAFQAYVADAQSRYDHDHAHPDEPAQLRPGEDYQTANGKIMVSGQVAVMSINGLLVKTIIDQTPAPEVFIEESFPIDWMYPHLEPHGLILKLHRSPLAGLGAEVVQKDFDYWQPRLTGMVGGWLKPGVSTREVCDFATKVHIDRDLTGFAGDPKFVRNDYSMRAFSKLRSAIAGVYEWRARNSKSALEKERMGRAAGDAFRQAFALSPSNADLTTRWVRYLTSNGNVDEARLVAMTASKVSPGNATLSRLNAELQKGGTPSRKE
ncbi:MAG TPA: hypothetical protein DCM86_13580 [Verrucomicrobiales bacterium]|nr:hypothetical protein [Verrucomicrobiales bacterium]